jgi:hypothetical protein
VISDLKKIIIGDYVKKIIIGDYAKERRIIGRIQQN